MKRVCRQYAASAAVVLLLLCFITLNAHSQPPGELRVSFINVGQGDSALLRDANGFDVLIDGGEESAGPAVLAYLRNAGVDDIDVLAASHADSDHIGGLIAVLEAADIPVEAVVYNGYPGTTGAWNDFISAAAARGLTPTAAQFPGEFVWGEMAVHVLNPVSGLSNPDTNDASVVLRVDHGDVSFLFTGDIDSTIEAQTAARGTPVAAEVLKVTHHGSKYGSSLPFLQAVMPQVSIISVGQNSYGHPAPETIDRLRSVGSDVWRTDFNGNIVVISDGFSVTVIPEYVWSIIFLPVIARGAFSETPVPVTGDIAIQSIFYDGTGSTEPDEYVVIENVDDHAVNVQSWTLRDNADHVFTFPAFIMQAGQVCRVYTNQDHPEWCGFNYRSAGGIWNNSGDCAYLRDAAGQDVSSMCY